MSILQKDYIYKVIPGESYTTSTPGTPATPGYWTSLPPAPTATITDSTTDAIVTTAAINETPGYIRLATWTEVKLIWPWLTSECAIQIRLLETIWYTKTLGETIFEQYLYRVKDQPLDGGRLQMYRVYIAIQRINGGIGFCAVTAPKENIVIESNPFYMPDYEYVEGIINGC